MEKQSAIESQIMLESRLTRVESSTVYIQDEIKDIKKNLRWLTGIIFTLNTTILGVVIKGFGILGQ